MRKDELQFKVRPFARLFLFLFFQSIYKVFVQSFNYGSKSEDSLTKRL